MRGSALERHAVVHHGLDGIGLLRSRKLFLVGLAAGVGGNCQCLGVEVLVDLQHLLGLLSCLFLSLVHGVTLLPQELGGAQEGTGGLFPSDDVAPLVVELGQVAVGLDHRLEVLAEERFGGGADGKTLGELVLAAKCYPRALGRKSLNVILFLLEKAFGDKHGHVNILVTERLEARVKILLNVFPNCIAVGTDDHASLDAGVVNQLCFFYNVGEPLCEVYVHGRDLLHHFCIVLCHDCFVRSFLCGLVGFGNFRKCPFSRIKT